MIESSPVDEIQRRESTRFELGSRQDRREAATTRLARLPKYGRAEYVALLSGSPETSQSRRMKVFKIMRAMHECNYRLLQYMADVAFGEYI